jgi:acetyl-CoA acetyltransferase
MADRHLLRNKVAIIGVGYTKATRHDDCPVAALAVQASDAAILDAGLTRSDIDGIACGAGFPAYSSAREHRDGIDVVSSEFLARHMALPTEWSLNHDSFPPALAQAVFAVGSGAARYALINRTLHQPPGRYNSFAQAMASGPTEWTAPYGYAAPTIGMAMLYMEYQQRYDARREDMATLVLQLRKNVQQIPEAYWYGTSLTFDDYMTSRTISEPMCLYDNDIPVDGSASFVITSAERAQNSPHKPVYFTNIAAVSNPPTSCPGSYGPLDDYYEYGHHLADRLWSQSGWRPADVDVPQLYDGFTPLVYLWLETLGFCPVGQAWQFIQDGHIANNGKFPLLSGGGNQGWGRLHGLPHVLECYLQLAGRAGSRQLARATTGLSTYATPTLGIGQAILYSSERQS